MKPTRRAKRRFSCAWPRFPRFTSKVFTGLAAAREPIRVPAAWRAWPQPKVWRSGTQPPWVARRFPRGRCELRCVFERLAGSRGVTELGGLLTPDSRLLSALPFWLRPPLAWWRHQASSWHSSPSGGDDHKGHLRKRSRAQREVRRLLMFGKCRIYQLRWYFRHCCSEGLFP